MTSDAFVFEPDLARAATIPASWYTDPAQLAMEKGRIFRRTWQYAASLDALRFPGNYVATEIVGIPIVLTRDLQGTLRAFYNVCRHRAGRVAKGAGNRKTLQCAYHGWLYGLDGCLRTTPEFEGAVDFNREDYGLLPIRVETWGPFAFVNMDATAPSLLETLGDIPRETARFEFDAMRRVERRDYYVDANWKVYIDNYLEGYHVPVAHPGLYRELDYENYRVDTFRYYSSQYAPIRPVKGEDACHRAAQPRPHVDNLRVVLCRPRHARNVEYAARFDGFQRRDPARRHRDLRGRVAQPAKRCLHRGALLRQTRKRRAPFSRAVVRIPRSLITLPRQTHCP